MPDLSGCLATGATVEDAVREIRAAIRFHLDGLIADGERAPEPTSAVAYVEA